jgi:hypothetical protein
VLLPSSRRIRFAMCAMFFPSAVAIAAITA